MRKYKVLSHILKAVAIHSCLHMLSGENFGGILMGNTRCFGGISQLPENRPWRVLLLLASMSARAIFLVLVLSALLDRHCLIVSRTEESIPHLSVRTDGNPL